MKTKTFITCILTLLSPVVFGQELARFVVENPGPDKINALVCVPLDGINYNADKGAPALFQVERGTEKYVPSQQETGVSAQLWFAVSGMFKTGEKKEYILRTSSSLHKKSSPFSIETDDEVTTIKKGDHPVLSYQHAVKMPPEGADLKYKRSGFIHPLWSPEGEVMTRIQAPDHYHHYGIWNPWTVTHFDGKEVDFWNLAKGQGTVRFAGYLDRVEGDVFTGFKVRQEHVAFEENNTEKTAINEVWDVRVWNLDSQVYVIDLTTTLNTPLPDGILLDAYRYGGGIGYRATEKWTKDNCTVLTSDGKTRADADGSFASWCIVEGESATPERRSGILFLSHPSNRKHPEPMRVWPLDANNGRGDMYFEFVPIRHEDWQLKPRHNYTLKYRMIVFDGKIDSKKAGLYWNSFASLPVVKFIKK